MTSSNDVTIVVCTRERAVLLRGALRAIRECSPADVEIIVVDSASTTADTRAVVAESGVRYMRSDVKGLSIARNIGWRASERAVVIYTDDDCTVTPGWIDSILPAFIDGIGAVTGRLLDHSAPLDPAPLARRLDRVQDGLDAGHGAVMAFRRSVLAELDGFDDVLGAGRRAAGAEDLDMFCRVLRSGSGIAVEPASVVRHLLTRDDEEFLSLNSGYGRGLGAMSSKWLRFALSDGILLTIVMFARGSRRAIRHARSPRMRSGALSLLRGIFVGLVEAMPMRIRGQRFIDSKPPAPIVLSAEDRSPGGSR